MRWWIRPNPNNLTSTLVLLVSVRRRRILRLHSTRSRMNREMRPWGRSSRRSLAAKAFEFATGPPQDAIERVLADGLRVRPCEALHWVPHPEAPQWFCPGCVGLDNANDLGSKLAADVGIDVESAPQLEEDRLSDEALFLHRRIVGHKPIPTMRS